MHVQQPVCAGQAQPPGSSGRHDYALLTADGVDDHNPRSF